MNDISDVFQFASRNPDYWAELLDGGDYGDILDEDDVRALEAGRKHVGSTVVALLTACGKLGIERLREKQNDFATKRFQPGATERKRRVDIPAPARLGKYLYRLEFLLKPDEGANEVMLFGQLVTKKSHKRALEERLAAAGGKYWSRGYVIRTKGIALTEGSSIDAIARAAVDDLVSLFDAAVPA